MFRMYRLLVVFFALGMPSLAAFSMGKVDMDMMALSEREWGEIQELYQRYPAPTALELTKFINVIINDERKKGPFLKPVFTEKGEKVRQRTEAGEDSDTAGRTSAVYRSRILFHGCEDGTAAWRNFKPL